MHLAQFLCNRQKPRDLAVSIPIYTIDAFANRPFSGNPAGVCILHKERSERWMQGVATEMRHSETAFITPREDRWGLRWFTPTTEVDLCGHATLAAAHVLWVEEKAVHATETILFETKSGELRAEIYEDAIRLDFPTVEVIKKPFPREFARMFTSGLEFVGRNKYDWLVELPSEDAVRYFDPDLDAIKDSDCRGLIITAASSPGRSFDYVSRYFAPAVGVNEDAVTGSAHCALAPYWSRKLNTKDLTGFQVSSRGGFVNTRFEGHRVYLRGAAHTVLSGRLHV